MGKLPSESFVITSVYCNGMVPYFFELNATLSNMHVKIN